MLKYNRTHRKYSGDTNMRPDTHQNQPAQYKSNYDARVKRGRPLAEDLHLYNIEKPKESKYRRGENSRLRGSLTQLNMHLKYAETGNKHVNSCKVCGKVAYSKCSICGVYRNLMANRGKLAGRTCFFDYHTDIFWFGTWICRTFKNQN